MKVILDEMWTPTIAVGPRKRGFEVIPEAGVEPFNRAHYLRPAPDNSSSEPER